MFLVGDNISGDVTVEGSHGRDFIREDSEWVGTKGLKLLVGYNL